MIRSLAWIVLCTGLVVRLGIWAANPPGNAYDDHLTAIQHYATHLQRPAPSDCWKSYQPPMYYMIGAATLRFAQPLVGDGSAAWKCVQLISTLASWITLLLCWSILRDFHQPGGTFALAFIAFLPRDLYTSAMISNDALLIFWVTLAIWGFWQVRRLPKTRRGWVPIGMLTLGCLGAALTKQSGLIIGCLPAWLLLEASWRRARHQESWSFLPFEVGLLLLVLVLMPLDEVWRTAETGRVLASNQDFYGSPTYQLPGDLSQVSFGDFRVSALAKAPQLGRETVGSFWTELYARFWTDYEPRFFPATATAEWLARVLLAVGIIPTILGLTGLVHIWLDRSMTALLAPVLLVILGFLCVPIIQTIRFPYYSSMKAMLVLPALAGIGLCFASGSKLVWQKNFLRIPLVVSTSAYVLIGTVHVLILLFFIADGVSGISGPIWPLPPAG